MKTVLSGKTRKVTLSNFSYQHYNYNIQGNQLY